MENYFLHGKPILKHKPKLAGCVVFLFLLLNYTWNVGLAAEERPEQKDTLIGVKDLFVYVDIGLSLRGPLQEQLQGIVEDKLKGEGLTIHPQDEEEDEETTLPRLHVDVAVLQGAQNYSFFVTARLFQVVRLNQGAAEIEPYAATWALSAFGIGGIEDIQEKVEDLCEIFLIDYRTVNTIEE